MRASREVLGRMNRLFDTVVWSMRRVMRLAIVALGGV